MISQILEKIFSNRLLTHVLYWTIIVLIAIVYGIGYGEPLELAIILKKISLPAQVLASYLFIYVQLPLLYKKKYWVFLLSFFASTFVFHIIMHLCNDLWFGKDLISYHSNHTFLEIIFSGEYYLNYAVDIYMVVFVTAGIKLIKDNLENKKVVETLEAEKAKKEYQYLQARLQPEFLLNTLDQIERQSKSNNEKAAESIADLSDILDYSLYKANQTTVSLRDECRQMKLFSQLYLTGSKSISSLRLTQSNISNTAIVQPMILVKIITGTLVYLEKITGVNKSLTIETTSIDNDVLLDINIYNIDSESIKTKVLQESVAENVLIDQLDISIYPLKNGCNIQIKITTSENIN